MEANVLNHIPSVSRPNQLAAVGVITFVMANSMPKPLEARLAEHVLACDSVAPWRPSAKMMDGTVKLADELPSIAYISPMLVQMSGKLALRKCSFTIAPLCELRLTQLNAYTTYVRNLAERLSEYGITGVSGVECRVEFIGGHTSYASTGHADISHEAEFLEAGTPATTLETPCDLTEIMAGIGDEFENSAQQPIVLTAPDREAEMVQTNLVSTPANQTSEFDEDATTATRHSIAG